MNEIKTKWLGGTTAKDYIAGSVELISGTKDKPKYKKLHYWKYFLTDNFVVYEIPNPSAPIENQIRKGVTENITLLVKSIPEVIEHIK
tara:strand:- start:4336 stop:4599 length:264 start_codon:yes stop_codon:yes gene_type:complete